MSDGAVDAAPTLGSSFAADLSVRSGYELVEHKYIDAAVSWWGEQTAALAAAATIRAAAQAGDIGAQATLGGIYCEGRAVPRDPAEGLHWYTLAANSGDAMAMNMVGRCHELGHGTPANVELAAAWYRTAARNELDWGMYNYAQLLAGGRGVKIDRAAALHWYRRAAALGHAKSMNWIGRFHDEGWVVARDANIAFEWYRRSAEGGDFRGQASYASVLAQRGDVDAALTWLRRAMVSCTATFRRQLRADLAVSPHAAFRAFAAQIRDEPLQK